MYIRDVHIEIEQGLQQVGVFAYDDFQPEEVDIAINQTVYDILKDSFSPIRPTDDFQARQAILDKFQQLEVKNYQLQELQNLRQDDLQVYSLPNDYIHLISSRSIFSVGCVGPVDCIRAGKQYEVKGDPIRYNGILYSKGQTFTGVEGIKEFTFPASSYDLDVREVITRISPNRLIQSEYIEETLTNELKKTRIKSPVTSIADNKFYIYRDNFLVTFPSISYIREPRKANILFTRYSAGASLIEGKVYEVIQGSILYNGTTYNERNTFTVVTGVNTFTGTGQIREFTDGDLEFSMPMCQEIIHKTVQRLSIISEQSQQKIVNLVQQDNV